MNSSIIDRLLQIGSLKQRANSVVLARPVSIVVRANVLKEIRSIYEPSREHGGILIMKPAANRGEFVIDSVLVMPNVSNDPAVGFLPDAAAMTAATSAPPMERDLCLQFPENDAPYFVSRMNRVLPRWANSGKSQRFARKHL